MEFKKVGNELHLLDEENNIPLYIIGEGFVKRLCNIFHLYYRNYYKVPYIPKFQDFPAENDTLAYFQDMFGEQNGKLLFEICSNESIFFRDFIGSNYLYSLPEGRDFTFHTSDFVSRSHKNLDIVEEDIIVRCSIEDGCYLNKYPLVYDIFSVQQRSAVKDPILSNETVDIYYEDDRTIKFGVKKLPLNLDKLTSANGINFSFSEIKKYHCKCSLIYQINQKSLIEQSLALSDGSRTLKNTIIKCTKIPDTEIVMRWSKYLHITSHLREILKKRKKTEVCPFIRRYLRCDMESKKQLMSMGDTLIADIISTSAPNRDKIFTLLSYRKSDVQLAVELSKRYGDGWSTAIYKHYINLRKSLGKITPVFPRTWYDVLDLERIFNEEQEELMYLGINISPKTEFEFEDENITAIYPRTGIELYREGKNLHHCVGSYVNYVTNERTNILFLRRKDDPEEAFYTVEVDNEYEIVQVRGLQNNTNYPEDLQKFLKKYKKYLKYLKKKR